MFLFSLTGNCPFLLKMILLIRNERYPDSPPVVPRVSQFKRAENPRQPKYQEKERPSESEGEKGKKRGLSKTVICGRGVKKSLLPCFILFLLAVLL